MKTYLVVLSSDEHDACPDILAAYSNEDKANKVADKIRKNYIGGFTVGVWPVVIDPKSPSINGEDHYYAFKRSALKLVIEEYEDEEGGKPSYMPVITDGRKDNFFNYWMGTETHDRDEAQAEGEEELERLKEK